MNQTTIIATENSLNISRTIFMTKLTRQHWEACMDKRLWPMFIGCSAAVFFGGIIIILIYRLLSNLYIYLRNLWIIRNDNNAHDKGLIISHLINDGNEFSRTNNPENDHNNCGSLISLSRSTLLADKSSFCSLFCTKLQTYLDKGRYWAIRLVSYQWIPGRIFIALTMIFSLMSFGIYAYEATMWPNEIEKCGHKGRRFRLMDFLMNLFFLTHFLIRLIASRNALLFWIEWYSILDYLTVPPTIIGFFMQRSWIGFRFVRIFRLGNLAEVLNNLNLIKSVSSLKLCQLCTYFLSIWFAGAGMIHLLENTGNIFGINQYKVQNSISYIDALYFTIVTMSTVGYGDITPQTYFGRIFVCLFILFALATFASAIPEIVDMFFTVHKYNGIYQKNEGKSHIIVCGDITTDSVQTFLSDFLHEDRQKSDVEVVFINRSKPDIQLQSLLRRHFLRVKYFQGTVMDHGDLQRVRMYDADACLILASATTTDPYQTDAANVMRVIAVKNFASHVRVIVQLLQTENKAYLLNSPYWNWDAGDEIVCFSELKLGFLAQSCIAPGFSTLLTNLFTMHSIKGLKEAARLSKINRQCSITHKSDMKQYKLCKSEYTNLSQKDSHNFNTSITNPNVNKKSGGNILNQLQSKLSKSIKNLFRKPTDSLLLSTIQTRPNTQFIESDNPSILHQSINDENWFNNYLHGASMEIYSARFSIAFEGLTFTEAAIVCRKQLDLLLIAIVAKKSSNSNQQFNSKSNDPINQYDLNKQSKNENNEYLNENDDLVDVDEEENVEKYYLAISPTLNSEIIISHKTLGFFICDSQNNANKVKFYCIRCHGNENINLTNLKMCSCYDKIKQNKKNRISRLLNIKTNLNEDFLKIKTNKNDFLNNKSKMNLIKEEEEEEGEEHLNQQEKAQNLNKINIVNEQIQNDHLNQIMIKPNVEIVSVIDDNNQSSRTDSLISIYDNDNVVKFLKPNELSSKSSHLINGFDITGMYHYCDWQNFEDNYITSDSCHIRSDLINHILLCILAEPDSPSLGLHSFVMPLRSSNFRTAQLKPILLLGNVEFLRKEWPNIANFPRVYTLGGSPLSRNDLRQANIQYSSVCVVISSRSRIQTDDSYLLDKEVILCTLNIKAMKFMTKSKKYGNYYHLKNRKTGSEIPLITELMTDNNIHYLDPGNSNLSQITASLSTPFARGIAFTSSVLDVLASTAYFDRNSMTIIRHLVTGGVTPVLEQWLAEGGGLIGYHELKSASSKHISPELDLNSGTRASYLFPNLIEVRQRPRIEQIPITNTLLLWYQDDKHITYYRTYGDLFCNAIKKHGILCLGIYRIAPENNQFNKRLFTVPTDLELNLTTKSDNIKKKIQKTNLKSDLKDLQTFPRRLSTCAIPVDRMLRKHSLQTLRKSTSLEDNLNNDKNDFINENSQSNIDSDIKLRSHQYTNLNEILTRYVITNPPNNFQLHPTDLIFCLCPFENDEVNLN